MVHLNCTVTRDCEDSPSLSANTHGASVLDVERTDRAVNYGTMGYLSEGPMLCTKKHNQACAERDEETVPSKKAGYVLEEPMVYTKKHRRTHADTTSKKTTSSPTRKNDQTPVEIPAFKRCRRPSRPEDRDRHLLPFQSWTLNLRRHEYNRNHPLFETPSPTEPELLFCSFCGVMHPSALFSEEEREKAHGERMCHDVTGSIRVCSHLSVPMVDVWKWFDTGLALRQAGKEDRIEPLVRACERCRGLLNLDEFGAAVRFARPPSMTVHPHDTEWFDVFSEVEVSWTLPVFNSAQRDVADNTTSEDFLKWNLEELERRYGRVLCAHVDRLDIVRAFGSEHNDGGGVERPRATECDACSAVYSWEKHEDIEFLRMVSSGRLVKKDDGKRCFEGYRGLIESVSSSPSGLS